MPRHLHRYRTRRLKTEPAYDHSLRIPITVEQFQMLELLRGYIDISACELLRRDLERHYLELVPQTQRMKKPRGPKPSEVVSQPPVRASGSERKDETPTVKESVPSMSNSTSKVRSGQSAHRKGNGKPKARSTT
jgi:hypothetical protein